MPNRRTVVELARSWVDTPFVHQGRSRFVRLNGKRTGGIDCAGLIVVVGHDSGMLPASVDVPAYRRFPDGKTIRAMLGQYAVEIPMRNAQPGDVACFRVIGSRFPHHLAILSDLSGDRLGMIHSFFELRRVVESGYSEPWLSRTVSVHSWPELEGVPW